MRLVWRRVPPENFNHELVWLAVSAGAFVAGSVWLSLGFYTLRCPFLAVTGYPCLTCGATRSAIAFAHGHFFAAWTWNPLVFLALCGVALFDLYALIVLITRSPRLRIIDWTRTEKNFVRVVVVLAIAVNWIYLLGHRAHY